MSKYDLSRFRGIFVALNPPYGEDGRVDPAAVKKLCRWYIDRSVTGLYICGSTGEGLLMSAEERKLLLESAAEEAGREMVIISHVGAMTTEESVELAKHAAEVDDCAAVSALPCVYYRIPESAIEAHWNAIIDATDLPFIIYNIPSTTGYDLSYELFSKMVKREKVIGLKNSGLVPYQIQQYRSRAGKDFVIFNGPDEQFLAGRIMGADAGIGGTYGTIPELFLKIERCYRAGDIEEAQHWQFIASDIITELLSFPSLYGASKSIIRLRTGINLGQPRLPIPPVPVDYPGIRELAERIDRVCNEAAK